MQMTREDPMRAQQTRRRSVSPVASLLAIISILGAVDGVRGQSLLSETTWGGPSFEVTEGTALAPDGSAYLVGRTGSFIFSHASIFLVRFAPDGATIAWQRTWEAPNPFIDDTSSDVAVAADGSAYVAGRTLGVNGDALLLKFDPDGTLLWQRSWGRGADNSESADAVAIAADGSVYVTGGTTRFDTGASSLAVLKFSSAGDRKSTRLNSSHLGISYAVFCLKKKNTQKEKT